MIECYTKSLRLFFILIVLSIFSFDTFKLNIYQMASHSLIKASERHTERIKTLLGGNLYKDRNHPVYNFLFEYFHFKPSLLFSYSPGIFYLNEDISIESLTNLTQLSGSISSFVLPVKEVSKYQIQSYQNTLEILKNSYAKSPFYGCFGMHEWAMLYQPLNKINLTRQRLPLRLNLDQISKFVDSRPLRCTHFDAFRFFSEGAKPMNIPTTLNRTNQPMNEQPGCVHANMDLFKWAIKLYPLTSSDILADCFELAMKARELDMRASPYNLMAYKPPSSSELYFDPTPICIETNEGRKEYQKLQEDVYQKSQPIRLNLINYYEAVLKKLNIS